MNQAIAGDVRFFLASVLLGISAAFCYDLLRVWRRLFRHSLFFVSLQDFVYWFLLGMSGFLLIYRYNAGIIRFFVLLGIVLGVVVYLGTIGRFFVRSCVKTLRLLGSPLQKGLLFLKKQGKLISSKRSQNRQQKDRGRKAGLAAKKRKEKNRS